MEVGEEAAEVLVALAGLDEDGDLEGMRSAECGVRNLQSGADEGADVVLFGGLVGAGGSVDAHVVGEGEGGVAEFGGTADEVLGMAGAAEEGEAGAGVEFGEHFFRRQKTEVSEYPEGKEFKRTVLRSVIERRTGGGDVLVRRYSRGVKWLVLRGNGRNWLEGAGVSV